MRRPVLLSAFAIFALSACDAPESDDAAVPETASASAAGSNADPATAGEEGMGEAQMPLDDAEADDGQCGGDRVREHLNLLPTDDVKAAIAGAVGDRPIRYYTQGDPVTMDFNPDRLNVELGEDGRIKVFRCG